jgi:P27 family predicted phage terminase small subunit
MSRDSSVNTRSKDRTVPVEAKTGEGTGEVKPIIECPLELGPVARREWDRIVSVLNETGVLTPFDRGPLAIYCVAYQLWLEAAQALEKFNVMLKSPNGFPQQSPYLSVLNKQAEIMMKISSEFGFTPASRGRRWMLETTSLELLDLDNIGSAGL